ncbi:hypothetical protein VKT23_016662 [Stygiomarasmius scandens]|uniref:Uncharacterized protein n=1 Tax=Marasmiellus scandens TaxID=2682957 RepID=A0ABR1IU44_9AGAR
MAKAKTSKKFELMLAAARKKSSQTRRPWCHHIQRLRIKITALEKRRRKEARQELKQEYMVALQEAFKVVIEQATALQERFGKHDVQWYLDELMQTHRLKQTKKKLSAFQAFVSIEVKRINSEIPEGQPRKKVGDCMGEIKERWSLMSKETQESITADALKELESNCENKELAADNNTLSAFHDVRTTLDDVKVSLQRLNAHTNMESILISVRSNLDHFNAPEVFVTSEHVKEFFDVVIRQTPADLASRLEGHCISGIEGITRTYIQETTAQKAELAKLISEKLHRS